MNQILKIKYLIILQYSITVFSWVDIYSNYIKKYEWVTEVLDIYSNYIKKYDDIYDELQMKYLISIVTT